MSLTVFPYIRHQVSGDIIDIQASIQAPFNDLFGVEIWRSKVWGSKTLEQMGCKILNTLKNSDIYAENDEITQLETELLKIVHHIEEVSNQLNIHKDSLLFRVKNALEAIKVAKEQPNGGVCIG